jgi:hypothetical protein
MIEFLEKNMFDCFWVKNFNVECLGCGFQRSLIFLLEGNFKSSLITYPALIPILILILYLILHLVFKFTNGHRWIIFMFIITVSIMTINYIIKLI